MFSASSGLLSKSEDLPCVAHGSALGSLQAGDACACTVAHLLPRHKRAADAATRAHRIGPCAHRKSCAAGGALGARAPTARAGGGSSWGGSPVGRGGGAQVRRPCCQQSSRLVRMRLLAALVRPAPAAGGEQGAAEAHALQLLLTRISTSGLRSPPRIPQPDSDRQMPSCMPLCARSRLCVDRVHAFGRAWSRACRAPTARTGCTITPWPSPVRASPPVAAKHVRSAFASACAAVHTEQGPV